MTYGDWRKPCEHGEYKWHLIDGLIANGSCPGGSPVTTTDLERLGESRYWRCVTFDGRPGDLQEHEPPNHWTWDEGIHRQGCGWRVLIPTLAKA